MSPADTRMRAALIAIIVAMITGIYFSMREEKPVAAKAVEVEAVIADTCVSPVIYPENFNLKIHFPSEIERVSTNFFEPDTAVVHIKGDVLYLHFFKRAE